MHFASSRRRAACGKRQPPLPPHAQRSAEHLLQVVSSQFVRVRGRKEEVKAEPYVAEALEQIHFRLDATMDGREEEEDKSELFVLEDEDEKELLEGLQAYDDSDDFYKQLPECKEMGDGEDGGTIVVDDHIVLGLIGDPNMGKSTLLNEILGTKKVSTSATPGHTKHMQTHYVTPQLVLCDCPGVVFPQMGVPRPLQVIFGTYPIAQVMIKYRSAAAS